MIDVFSECVIKVFVNESPSVVSIILEFTFCAMAIICGVLINYRFLKRLEKEKRDRPAGRKGNVIEPIMTSCCWVQMIFWPIRLALAWTFHNEIIKAETMPIWLRYIILNLLMTGRTYLCYYSFFCAFIRYIYIVHYERVYHWDFELVAKRTRIASICIPFIIGILSITVVGGFQFQGNAIFDSCSDEILKEGQGKIAVSLLAVVFPGDLTILFIQITYYLIVIVWMILGVNLVEAFMYHSVFVSIRRYLSIDSILK